LTVGIFFVAFFELTYLMAALPPVFMLFVAEQDLFIEFLAACALQHILKIYQIQMQAGRPCIQA
jgi:hypothetical protein